MYQLLIKFKRKASGGSAGGSGVKNPPANARDAGRPLIQEDPAAVRTAGLSATATEPELWSRELRGLEPGRPGPTLCDERSRRAKSVRRTCRGATGCAWRRARSATKIEHGPKERRKIMGEKGP